MYDNFRQNRHHGKQLCGLYYKPMMIINDDSRVVNKLKASLTDDARVIIYDCQMFIVQDTDPSHGKLVYEASAIG